jgi:tRNA-specific 2-thiouridylase
VACNRTVKFGRLATLARVMGFDVLATGHHARLVGGALRRGADERKDQSYVLATTAKAVLEECLFPVGTMTKSEVRALAQELELRTAGKLESQDACFAASGESRAAFLGSRIGLTPATVVDARSGQVVGSVPAAELLTIGQRRGLSLGGGQPRRYVTSIRPDLRRVELGTETDLLTDEVPLAGLQSRGPALAGLPVLVQFSAHGPARPGTLEDEMVMMERPVRRPAPGQLAVFYSPGDWLDQAVVGSAEVA